MSSCVCGYASLGGNLSRHKKTCKEYYAQEKTKDLEKENKILKDKLKQRNFFELEDYETLKRLVDCEIQTNEDLQKENQQLKQELEECKAKIGKQGYNYIVHTRESQRTNENVFKIGRTKCIEKRLKQYPKGTKLVHLRNSKDDICSETILKRKFLTHFKQRSEYGSEYFEGDLSDMKIVFDKIMRNFVSLKKFCCPKKSVL